MKIVAIDLDGTLLHSDCTISSYSKEVIAEAVKNKATEIPAYVVGDELKPFTLKLGEMTDDERDIILKGCLINYNRV